MGNPVIKILALLGTKQASNQDVALARKNRVQTSNWYSRRTGTNVRLVQTSDRYMYKEKRRTLVELKKKQDHCYKK